MNCWVVMLNCLLESGMGWRLPDFRNSMFWVSMALRIALIAGAYDHWLWI